MDEMIKQEAQKSVKEILQIVHEKNTPSAKPFAKLIADKYYKDTKDDEFIKDCHQVDSPE